MICEVRCCYCNLLMGEKECEVPAGMTPVTHGICEACYNREIAPFEEEAARRIRHDLKKGWANPWP